MIHSCPMMLAQANNGQGSMLVMLLPLVLMFVVMYFLMIRPQKKRERQLKEQINQMKVGDDVMTIGGLIGRVASINDDEVTLYTSVANTMMTFKKSAISTIVKPTTPAEK